MNFLNLSNSSKRLAFNRLARQAGGKNWLWLKLLILTVIAAVSFEHSAFDIYVSQLFYHHGKWLIEKGSQPFAFIFYDAPKALLILAFIYLATVLMITYRWSLTPSGKIYNRNFNRFIIPLSPKEIAYLLTVIIVVPSTIALLKGVTHVSCPNQLTLFGGQLPYLSLWQNMVAQTPARCFPAAHASAGFSLYGLVFLPTLYQYRQKLFAIVTLLGWTMGLYKMLFGDHFFSHTCVSMLLSLTLTSALASIFFKNGKPKSIR